MISIIVAMTPAGVIGCGGTIPWNIPSEMEIFRQTTMGSTIIMGANTHTSIGRSLPGRNNVVVSTKLKHASKGSIIVRSLKDAVGLINPDEQAYIIGGSQLYKAALDSGIVDKLLISVILEEYPGDAYFPELDSAVWDLDVKGTMHTDEETNIDFITYEISKYSN